MAFSLNTLGDLNELITCWQKTNSSIIECNNRAQSQGETVLKLIDEDSEFGKLLKCCGAWIVRDCWADAAREANCTEVQVQMILNSPTKFMPELSNYCKSYPSGSLRCYTPHLVVGSIIFSFFFILLIIAMIIFFVLYRRRQQQKRERQANKDQEGYSPVVNNNKNDVLNHNHDSNITISNGNPNNNNTNINNNNIDELSKMINS